MSAGKHTDRVCPRCRFGLREVVVKDEVVVDHCYHCRGSFLDPGEETVLLGPLTSPEIWQESDLTKPQGPSALCSPVSGQPMQAYRLFFAEELVVERCEQSGGLWLDAGEGDKLREIIERASNADDSPLAEHRPQLGAGTYLFQFFSGCPVEVWNPRMSFPRVTVALIATCVVAFGIQMIAIASGGAVEQTARAFVLYPDLLEGHAVWGCITYMFLHGGVAHLLGNMYFLYIFGDNVEDKLGGRGFLLLFIVSGIAGALAQVVFQSPPGASVVGASGAVAGVMAVYCVVFPKVRVRMLIVGVPLYFSIAIYMGLWVAMNVGMLMAGAGGVAWLCHLGGFAAGAMIGWPYRRKSFADIMGERHDELVSNTH